MTNEVITQIVDKNLNWLIDNGVNILPGEIEPEMAEPKSGLNDEEWQIWLPIKSTVTDEQLRKVEQTLEHTLPESYKLFLKHKHFYELYISYAHFACHAVREWQHMLTDMAFDGYPREFLIDKGYIPFAHWHDWGLLCFDTNQLCRGNEYPVVMWDHERWDEFVPFSDSFVDLLKRLDAQGRETNV